MKRLDLVWMAAILLSLCSCEKQEELGYTTVAITVNYPADIPSPIVENEGFDFRNISTGGTASFAGRSAVALPEGLYDCTYCARIKFLSAEGDTVSSTLQGYASAVQLTGANSVLEINSFVLEDKDDFIIEEIFFTGTLQSSGKTYNGDNYVKIYNNTDHVLYADGIALMESKFSTTQKFDYTPDLMATHMTVDAVYVIPGGGTDHPVQPGESLLICDTGIDHRLSNPNSFDLSAADFEWYDVSTVPSQLDIDSPIVPNMDKWYCYTKSFWLLHSRGFKAYALARISVDKETFLKENLYQYTYLMVLLSGSYPMSQTAYKVPNEWIVDVVNASVASKYAWNVTAPSLDRGYTYCGTIDNDKTRYFKSVRRKVLFMAQDGRCVLKDTNNSTADFNPESVPSVIEEQHTAMDSNGTPATVETYDGVIPKE